MLLDLVHERLGLDVVGHDVDDSLVVEKREGLVKHVGHILE